MQLEAPIWVALLTGGGVLGLLQFIIRTITERKHKQLANEAQQNKNEVLRVDSLRQDADDLRRDLKLLKDELRTTQKDLEDWKSKYYAVMDRCQALQAENNKLNAQLQEFKAILAIYERSHPLRSEDR